jgi:outer membrane protein OmpA-like peptidoglycan-associated protein
MVGMVKGLPVEEMEKLILANSKVDDEDLRDLGDRRSKAVQEWLVEHGVSAEQVFLLPSKLGEETGKPAAENKLKSSRTDFSLK